MVAFPAIQRTTDEIVGYIPQSKESCASSSPSIPRPFFKRLLNWHAIPTLRCAVLSYHHFERNEKSLLFAACDSRFPHMCRELLHFPHLSFLPPVPYPPLRGTFPSRGRLFISSGEAATTALKFESRDWVYETRPH